MAKYPIVSQRGIPSPSGGFRASLSFPGAEGDMWQQIGRLGEKGQDLVLTEHLQRAFIEFEDAKSREELEDINFVNALRGKKEEEVYDNLMQKSIMKRLSFMPKNPLAAQQYRSYMKERQVELAEDVAQAKFIRRRETAEVERDAASAAGDMGRLAEITEAGIRTGLFDESDAREYYRNAVTTHQYKMSTQMAIANPEKMLDSIRPDGTLDPSLGFDALDVGHGQAIRNIAENSIWRKQKLVNEQAARDMSTLYNYSLDPKADLQVAQGMVDKWAWADGKQKIQGYDQFLKLIKMQAENKQIVMGSPTAQSPQMNSIMKDMDGFFDDLGDLWEKQDVRAAKIKARILLNERLGSGKDKTYRELVEEMLQVQRTVEKELEEGATEMELLPPVKSPKVSERKMPLLLEDAQAPYIVASGPESMQEPLNIPKIKKMMEAYMKTLPAKEDVVGDDDLLKYPWVLSDEDYEKLPSGTVFLDENAKKWRKP